jgi:outer membrane protein OmpA-like peptidoglycan-associated protein
LKLLLRRIKLAGAIAAMSLLVGACATSPPEQLEKARSSYQQAQQSNAAQYAPTELAEARKALKQAEQAYQEEGDEQLPRTLAYIAQRRAQEAMAQGKVNYLVTTREAKQQELVQRTDQARQRYQEELVRQRQINQMTAQQLEQQRAQLEQQRQRFAQERAQLDEQDRAAEDLRQRERDYQAAIQRLEVEIERREQAEDQLEEAMSTLEDVATVREEDGRGQVITLDNSVLFEVGKSELLPNARQRLKQVSDVLQMQQDRTITIEGHTDAQGSQQLNDRLSRDRAQSVKEYLVSRGLAADRIRTVGYGEERPIAGNESPEGRAMNRRVEIVLPTAEAVGGGPDRQDQQQQDQQQQDQQQQDQQPQQDMEPSEREMMEPSEPSEPSQEDWEADEPQDEEMLEEEPSPMD